MKQEAKIGLFVILACAAIAYFVVNTSEEGSALRFWQQSAPKRLLDVEMSDASGLRRGTVVAVSGVQVGTVQAIRLHNGKAILSLQIDRNLQLQEDAYASLASKGVLGDKYVALFPGTGSPLPEGQMLTSKASPSLDDIMSVVHELGESVLTITRKFEESLESGPDGNRFTTVAENVEELSRQLLLMVQNNQDHVGTMSANFSTMSTDLKNELPVILAEMKQLIADFRSVIQSEKSKISSTMDNASAMTERMNEAMGSVKSIVQKIDSGEGTIGKLISDNETASKVENILDQASTSLEQVQKYLAAADSFKINLEFDTHYLEKHEEMFSRFKFQIAPNENKYYQIDITSGSKDYLPSEYVKSNTDIFDGQGNLIGREIQLLEKEEDDYEFGLQFAYRFDSLTIRGGLIEGSGGGGLDYMFIKDRMKMSIDFFDFDRPADLNSHGRIDFTFRLPKGLRIIAGWDDILESDYSSVYIGAGIRWQDDDLKPLLASFSKAL